MENKDRQFKITSPSGTTFTGGSPEEFAAMFQKLSTNGRVDLIEQVNEKNEVKEQAKQKEERESQKEVEAVVRAFLASSKRLAQLEKELEDCKQKDLDAYLEEVANEIIPSEKLEQKEEPAKEEVIPEAAPEDVSTDNEEEVVKDTTESEKPTSEEDTPEEQKASLIESINANEEALEKTSWIRFKKRRELKKSIQNARLELQQIEKNELDVDKKEKSFLYFATNKITNAYTYNALFNKKLNSIDLRWLQDKDVYEFMRNRIEMVGQDEGFFEFNAFGLVKIIKNVKEVRSKEGINLYSEDALYKILGPDGTVIADDIKGYTEATDLYYKATNEYRDVLEKEFSELSK